MSSENDGHKLKSPEQLDNKTRHDIRVCDDNVAFNAIANGNEADN